jgi:hypothetical protein
MLQANPHAIHFNRVLNLDEEQGRRAAAMLLISKPTRILANHRYHDTQSVRQAIVDCDREFNPEKYRRENN